MKKDLYTITPDRGSNNGTLTITSDANPSLEVQRTPIIVEGGIEKIISCETGINPNVTSKLIIYGRTFILNPNQISYEGSNDVYVLVATTQMQGGGGCLVGSINPWNFNYGNFKIYSFSTGDRVIYPTANLIGSVQLTQGIGVFTSNLVFDAKYSDAVQAFSNQQVNELTITLEIQGALYNIHLSW